MLDPADPGLRKFLARRAREFRRRGGVPAPAGALRTV